MTNRELAEALREISGKNSVSAYKRGVCAEAADALANSETHIEALQKEIENLRKQVPQWVSVKERMPEPGVTVLVCDHDSHIETGERSKQGWLGGWLDECAAYWMPLPEPPSTEGGGVMERLTFEGNFCDIAQCTAAPCQWDNNCSQKQTWERLKAYEDTGLTPERCAELAEADKDGRLVVLPCKVGDTVYRLFCGSKVNPVISEVKINTINDAVAIIEKMGMHKYIGCFLTREEAKAALREAKKDG